MGISEWKNEATPERVTVGVCFDRRLLSDLEAAERELEAAQENKDAKMLGSGGKEIATLEERVSELNKAVEEKTRNLVFECIGRRKWSDLKAEHPPTEEQKEEFHDLDMNPEEFFAVAIAASCVEPGMTVDEAKWMLEVLPEAVCVRITQALTQVNYFGSRDPFAKGSAGALRSSQK